MNIKNGYCLRVGLVIGIFALHGNAAESWNIGNNSVTYSVSLTGIDIAESETSVSLSKLNLSEVAVRENVGTAANYALSSVVLSMNGVIVGAIYYQNNSSVTRSPTFVVTGSSGFSFGSDATASESYSLTTPLSVPKDGVYSDSSVSIAGSVEPKTVTITEGLDRFLGDGTETIMTMATFDLSANWLNTGANTVSWNTLTGSADISITYNYVPEPSSVALLTLGCAVLALRRKRKTV